MIVNSYAVPEGMMLGNGITGAPSRTPMFGLLGLGDLAGDVLDGFTEWALNAIIGTTIAVVDQITGMSSPSLRAGFFAGDGGPYNTILGLSGGIVGVFFFLAIAQGVLQGTAGPIARRALIDAPIGVLMILGTITFTELGVGLTDWLSATIMAGSIGRIDSLTGQLGLMAGNPQDASLLLVPSMLMMAGALLTALVLAVRSGTIFLIVAMSPILFATWLWPASRDIATKTIKVLFGVILAKLVITLGLVIGVGAITATIGTDTTGRSTAEAGEVVATAIGDDQIDATVDGGGAGDIDPGLLDEVGVPVGDGADPAVNLDTAPLLGTLLTGAAMFFLAAIAPLKLISILPGVELSAAAVSGQAGRVTQASMQGGYQVAMINRGLAQRGNTTSATTAATAAGPVPGMPPGPGSPGGSGPRGGGNPGGTGTPGGSGGSGPGGSSGPAGSSGPSGNQTSNSSPATNTGPSSNSASSTENGRNVNEGTGPGPAGVGDNRPQGAGTANPQATNRSAPPRTSTATSRPDTTTARSIR